MKAILVVDIDDDIEMFKVDVWKKGIWKIELYKRNLKLKPLPKQNMFTYESNDYQKGYAIGFNSCIEEILEGK